MEMRKGARGFPTSFCGKSRLVVSYPVIVALSPTRGHGGGAIRGSPHRRVFSIGHNLNRTKNILNYPAPLVKSVERHAVGLERDVKVGGDGSGNET